MDRPSTAPSPRVENPCQTVRAVRIDGTVVVGDWLGVYLPRARAWGSDQHSVEIRSAEGIQTIPFDELMRLTFGRPAGTPVEPTSGLSAGFHLSDGGFMHGEVVGQRPGAVVGRCPLGENLVMPFERLSGIQLANGETYDGAANLFHECLADRLPGHDVLVTRSLDDAKSLRGTLEQLGPERGSFVLAGGSTRATLPTTGGATPYGPLAQRVRTFRLEKIFGIVFAAGAHAQPTYPATVTLVEGSVFSGEVQSASAEVLRISTSLDVDVEVPVAKIADIRCRSRRVVYVSDLTPKAQRIEGRLHRPWPIRLDRSVAGKPLSVDGQHFEKGVGVHSRTELDYDLAGGYKMFVATVGIDDEVRPRGSVIFRVLGDGRVLHETALLTGTSDPDLCRVDVSGVTLLTLTVDYGDALDLADHADWGGARLLRRQEKGSGYFLPGDRSRPVS